MNATITMQEAVRRYLEDRRPNSQGDPYQIASQVLKTISEVSTGERPPSRPDRLPTARAT